MPTPCPQAHTRPRVKTSSGNTRMAYRGRFTVSILTTHPGCRHFHQHLSAVCLTGALRNAMVSNASKLLDSFVLETSACPHKHIRSKPRASQHLNQCSEFWVNAGERTLAPVKIGACPVPIVLASFVFCVWAFLASSNAHLPVTSGKQVGETGLVPTGLSLFSEG